MDKPKGTVTLLDVAKAAGVSKTTVSNVFSFPDRVRPALRERVEEASRALGYAGPDPRGRLLSSGKVNAIGVVPISNFGITLFFTHEYHLSFLAGVAKTCEERGVGVSLVSGRADQWGINEALVDGFILWDPAQLEMMEGRREGSQPGSADDRQGTGMLESAQRRRLPVVLAGVAAPGISSITYDNRRGMCQITRHLLDLGHRRFLIASSLWEFRPPAFHPPGVNRRMVSLGPVMAERLAGVADALAEFGLSMDDMPLMEACCTADEAEAFGDGTEMLLDHLGNATALIACSDQIALSALEHAGQRGISVPGELSITGFDDVAGAARSDPPLTTIHHSGFDNGVLAARVLLDGGPPRQIVQPVELVVRQSTARPRQGGTGRRRKSTGT